MNLLKKLLWTTFVTHKRKIQIQNNPEEKRAGVEPEDQIRFALLYSGQFEPWSIYVHQNEEQYIRFLRSKFQPLQLCVPADQTHTIVDQSREHPPSLRACACMDFRRNLREKVPCKHVYFLRSNVGMMSMDVLGI